MISQIICRQRHSRPLGADPNLPENAGAESAELITADPLTLVLKGTCLEHGLHRDCKEESCRVDGLGRFHQLPVSLVLQMAVHCRLLQNIHE
jgi:hypothetical protein